MEALQQTVLQTVRKHKLLQEGDRVFVALSGGADSVLLLHMMMALRDRFHLCEVQALHVHHGLRGDFADRDEEFVRELCSRHNIPLTVKHINTRQYAADHHQTLEEAGRNLRYAFFEENIAELPNAKIATAHTLDDNAETVLLHITRGCGLRGAGGIPVRRGNIIRPLLECSANDVRRVCREQNWQYMVDETNADTCFSRNRMRHEVLPTLSAVHADAVRNIARFADIASEEDAFLDTLALEQLKHCRVEYGYSIDRWRSVHPVLQRRMFRKAVNLIDKNCALEKQHIDDLLVSFNTHGAVNLPHDWRAVFRGKYFYFEKMRTSVTEQSIVTVQIDKPFSFGNQTYFPRLISLKEYRDILKIHKNLFNFCVSYDMIGEDILVRSYESGDTFHPYGRGCGKSLKKWFQENSVPPPMRKSTPIVVDERGIAALLGHAIDERVAVSSATQTILWFEKQ